MEKLERIKNSALWAAYGDALGFISELADEKGLTQRIKSRQVATTVAWKRRVGGRFGVVVELPEGCYSDDTQLRLSVSRSIRGDGTFDVEAFAKVELPVWLAYALGAGRGSKAAASSLARNDTAWMNNFYNVDESLYVNGGGNGAAMRIQPHVWSAKDCTRHETFLLDVIKNSICTHGHPRGILGAVFHALSLAHSISYKTVPEPNSWLDIVEQLKRIPQLIRSDSQLSDFWVPTWEKHSNEKLEDAFAKVVEECINDIKQVSQSSGLDKENHYAKIAQDLGCLLPKTRGSGTKTAIAATVLSWIFRENPIMALTCAANLLGSDTDTIATMAGAVLGATTNERPRGKICDAEYIEKEASRLCAISNSQSQQSFTYPDLLKWKPPTVQLDVVGTFEGKLNVAGLGSAKAIGAMFKLPSKNISTVWQWLELSYGQHVLAKFRSSPVVLSSNQISYQNREGASAHMTQPQQNNLLDQAVRVTSNINSISKPMSIDAATKHVINAGFDPELIGQYLLDFIELPNGIELAIGFSSIIAKAIKARSSQGKKL